MINRMQDNAPPQLEVHEGRRCPPHSVEAEQAILGGLIIDNRAWERVLDLVVESDFYLYEHRQIFRGVLELADRGVPFDVVTLVDHLHSRDGVEAFDHEYLLELAKNTTSVSNIRTYAEVVRERSLLRKLIAVCVEIADNAGSPQGQSTATLLEEAERKIQEISESKKKSGGPTDVQVLLHNALGKIQERSESESTLIGLSTGFDALDEMTLGLQEADLIVLAGRPSMGKTTFAMNLVENAVLRQDKVVLVYSLEMPSESLLMRMFSSLGGIDHSRIRTGKLHDDDWPRLNDAVLCIRDCNLYMDDTAGISPSEMRARTRRVLRDKGPIGLIMVDYLQLMQVPGLSGDNRTAEVSEISRSLKALAKEFNCPVVALSQLNRSLEQRENKRPVNSDLRESGAIEQDADVIMFVYRDEVYHPNSDDKGVAEIIIGKSRNGQIGTVRLGYVGHHMRFEDIDETDA